MSRTPLLNFFVLGDSGSNNGPLASLMNAYAVEAGKPKFVLLLGDNFYPNGVVSTDDPLFQKLFQDTFISHESLRVPWYSILGNHDYELNFQAQIDFTNSEKNLGNHWQMPSQNYSFRYGDFEFFGFDSNGVQFSSVKCHPPLREEFPRNISWVAESLARSTAPIKIVFAHHPFYSKGLHHGKLGRIIAEKYEVEKVLVEGGATAYFSGHEHVFQHTEASGVNHFDPSLHVDWFDDQGEMGFLSVKVYEDPNPAPSSEPSLASEFSSDPTPLLDTSFSPSSSHGYLFVVDFITYPKEEEKKKEEGDGGERVEDGEVEGGEGKGGEGAGGMRDMDIPYRVLHSISFRSPSTPSLPPSPPFSTCPLEN